MATNFNMIFFVLFVLLLGALSISNLIAAQSPKFRQPGQMYFALLYMVGAIVLIVYKINNP